jgi:DNA-binding NarL/FixJ family response regulator
VLRCLSRGLETNAIAAELALQPQTVKNIVGQILRKLGVRNRVEAAVYAVRMGL